MQRLALVLGFVAVVDSALGQQASMSRPVVKTQQDTVHIIVSFSSFSPGQVYRLGIGCTVGDLEGATLELIDENLQESLPVRTFRQGHNTRQWWDVEEINVKGYVLEGDALPAGEGRLRLTAEIPLTLANEKDRLFLFVARQYAQDVWYLEDGTPIEKADW